MIAVGAAKTGRRGAWTHRPLAWTVGGWQTPLQYRALGRAISVLARFQWVQPARRLFLSSLRRHEDHRRSVEAPACRVWSGAWRRAGRATRRRHSESRNAIRRRLTSSASSCWTQCPAALDQVDAARFFTCPGDLSSPRPRRRSLAPTIVIDTRASRSSSSEHVRMSCESTTRSASLPAVSRALDIFLEGEPGVAQGQSAAAPPPGRCARPDRRRRPQSCRAWQEVIEHLERWERYDRRVAAEADVDAVGPGRSSPA